MDTILLGVLLIIFIIICLELTLFIYWLMRVSGVELPQMTAFWQREKKENIQIKKEVPIEQFTPDPTKDLTLRFEETDVGHGVEEVEVKDNA